MEIHRVIPVKFISENSYLLSRFVNFVSSHSSSLSTLAIHGFLRFHRFNLSFLDYPSRYCKSTLFNPFTFWYRRSESFNSSRNSQSFMDGSFIPIEQYWTRNRYWTIWQWFNIINYSRGISSGFLLFMSNDKYNKFFKNWWK